MDSQANQFEKRILHKQTLALGARVLLFVLVWCVQMIYIPTSNRIFGGIEPKLPIDIFPIWAVWVLPYVLCYPLWLAGITWAVFKIEDGPFRSLVAAFLVTCMISMLIYIFFPTYVGVATIHGSDVFSTLLRYIHENSGRYDAFPSGHIYITVLLALFYNHWYPRYKYYWIMISVIIAFSTLFTHQHFVVDIVGGWMVAWIGYHSGLRWPGFPSMENRATHSRLVRSSQKHS